MKEAAELINLPIYKKITDDLEDLLRSHSATVKCHLFGSRILGIANKDSQLDIFVDMRKLNYICYSELEHVY